jgi:hypothetical protein
MPTWLCFMCETQKMLGRRERSQRNEVHINRCDKALPMGHPPLFIKDVLV